MALTAVAQLVTDPAATFLMAVLASSSCSASSSHRSSCTRTPTARLEELDTIPERELIETYPFALAAYAELRAWLADLDEARSYPERALNHQASPTQRRLLERKLSALHSHDGQ